MKIDNNYAKMAIQNNLIEIVTKANMALIYNDYIDIYNEMNNIKDLVTHNSDIAFNESQNESFGYMGIDSMSSENNATLALYTSIKEDYEEILDCSGDIRKFVQNMEIDISNIDGIISTLDFILSNIKDMRKSVQLLSLIKKGR